MDKINAVKCLICEDIIESKHRHDFKTCSCGNVSVDGGLDYLKRNFRDKDKYIDLCVEKKVKKIKSSPNIIDLIEVGDYINGCKVLHKTNEYMVIVESKNNDGLFSHELKHITINNIESICKKESFERVSYDVE